MNRHGRTPGNLTRLETQGQVSTKPGTAVDANAGVFSALQKDLHYFGQSLSGLADRVLKRQKQQSREAGRLAGFHVDLGTGSQNSSKEAKQGSVTFNGDIRSGIIETADALGISAEDLATAISYETAGTFDPTKKGPRTQWGQHRGLIQFGEPQAKEYGVDWNNPIASQLGRNGAIFKYLKKAGVKPGMKMLDIYSAINAGSVGRYHASDANNGGAPGTVRDKVEKQMSGHRKKAIAFLKPKGGATRGKKNWDAYHADPHSGSMTYEEWEAQRANAPASKIGTGRPGPSGPALALRRDNDLRGPDFYAAQNRAISRRLPSEISNQVERLYEEHKDNPDQLKKAFDEAEKGVLASLAQISPDPEIQFAAKQLFAQKRKPYERSSLAEEEKRVRDGELEDYKSTVASSLKHIEKQAYLAGNDEDAIQGLSATMGEALAEIDQAEETGLISPRIASEQRTLVRTQATSAQLQGVFESLPTPDEKQAFIEELRKDWEKGKGMVGEYSLAQMQKIEQRFGAVVAKEQRQAKADNALAKTRMQRMVNDDLASVSRDGVGLDIDGEALSFEQVRAVLGGKTALDWERKRTIGHETFKAVSELDILPADEIAEQLQKLEPKPGSQGYHDQLTILSNVNKAVQGIIKLRKTDPAQAVDQAFDELESLREAARQGDLASLEELIRERFDAQTAIGIPDRAQAPLTLSELTALAEPVALDAQKQSWLDLSAKIDQTYGPFADEVIAQVFQWKGLHKTVAAAARNHLRTAELGQRPSRLEARTTEDKVLSSGSMMAMDGQHADVQWKSVPNQDQIEMLWNNPNLSEKFDEEFGNGTAAYYQRVLEHSQKASERYQQTLENKGIVIHDDGSEDYDPEKDRRK